MFYNDENNERLKKVMDSFPTPVRVKNSKKVSYAWIANIEFERISKLLEKGATFISLFEHLMLNGLLPEDGDEAKLRQAYRREERRRLKSSGEWRVARERQIPLDCCESNQKQKDT